MIFCEIMPDWCIMISIRSYILCVRLREGFINERKDRDKGVKEGKRREGRCWLSFFL